ncbi:hypothetical protein J6590_054520 [Homalodisca vitripennis]|nr:hypothetical protein J6590_054520 [Homalodisca vitripennis]
MRHPPAARHHIPFRPTSRHRVTLDLSSNTHCDSDNAQWRAVSHSLCARAGTRSCPGSRQQLDQEFPRGHSAYITAIPQRKRSCFAVIRCTNGRQHCSMLTRTLLRLLTNF